MSPANLLAVANIDAVDVVVIDAEGMDAEIVAAFLPLWPRVLIFEVAHMSRGVLRDLLKKLADGGYAADCASAVAVGLPCPRANVVAVRRDA